MVADLAAAVDAGVALDFTRDPERPVLRYPPAAEVLVRPLLDEAYRPELRRVLALAAAYRRALLDGGQDAEALAADLGPTLAEAVRRTLPGDASAPVTHRDALYRDEFIRARAIGISGNTRHHASPAPMRHPPALPRLDPGTVREVLGDRPDPHAVACLAWDVMNAVRDLEQEILSGVIAAGPRLVHGRPLGDWLDLGDVARLLRAWRSEA